MMPEKRRREIYNYINLNKTVTINEIGDHFNISVNTVRRDLVVLINQGLINKVYGGASKKELISQENSVSIRIRERTEEKYRIAHEAIKRIHNGDTIFLEAGSACLSLVKLLESKKSINVITTSPHILTALCDLKRINKLDGKIYCSGGIWLEEPHDMLIGPQAINFLESFRIEIAFVGFVALNPEDGWMVPTNEEAEIIKKVISISNKLVGITDSSKFGRRSLIKIGSLSLFNEIITDSNLDKKVLSKYSSETKITLV